VGDINEFYINDDSEKKDDRHLSQKIAQYDPEVTRYSKVLQLSLPRPSSPPLQSNNSIIFGAEINYRSSILLRSVKTLAINELIQLIILENDQVSDRVQVGCKSPHSQGQAVIDNDISESSQMVLLEKEILRTSWKLEITSCDLDETWNQCLRTISIAVQKRQTKLFSEVQKTKFQNVQRILSKMQHFLKWEAEQALDLEKKFFVSVGRMPKNSRKNYLYSIIIELQEAQYHLSCFKHLRYREAASVSSQLAYVKHLISRREQSRSRCGT
jgi:hypothetical protein